MIEWLITDYHFIPILIVLSLTIATVVIALVMSSEDAYPNVITFKISDWFMIAVLDLAFSSILSFFMIVAMITCISAKPVEVSDWKTIYSNGSAQSFDKTEIAKSLSEDQKISETAAAAIASNTSDPESNGVTIKVSFRQHSAYAGDQIGESLADVFSNLSDSSSKTVSISASKSDYEKSKDFKLTKDNLISNGDIDKSSKIVKVEIRTADHVETNFLGFKGTNKYIKPNEVRITLDNDSTVQQEVKQIFE